MNHHDGLTLVDLYFSRLNYTKSLHFRTIYKQKRDSAYNSQIFVVNKHRWPNKQGMIFAKLNSCQPAVQITRFYTHVCMHIFSVQSSSISVLNLQPPPEPAITILNYIISRKTIWQIKKIIGKTCVERVRTQHNFRLFPKIHNLV